MTGWSFALPVLFGQTLWGKGRQELWGRYAAGEPELGQTLKTHLGEELVNSLHGILALCRPSTSIFRRKGK
eukprot:scaffold164663_cov14-Tisochrysis_lutea.AAC.1